jgi:hypothetical protein
MQILLVQGEVCMQSLRMPRVVARYRLIVPQLQRVPYQYLGLFNFELNFVQRGDGCNLQHVRYLSGGYVMHLRGSLLHLVRKHLGDPVVYLLLDAFFDLCLFVASLHMLRNFLGYF